MPKIKTKNPDMYQPPGGYVVMSDDLRARCVEGGMPDDASNAQAQWWLNEHHAAVFGELKEEKTEEEDAGLIFKTCPERIRCKRCYNSRGGIGRPSGFSKKGNLVFRYYQCQEDDCGLKRQSYTKPSAQFINGQWYSIDESVRLEITYTEQLNERKRSAERTLDGSEVDSQNP